ncbi:MAG: 2-octaprenyl-3-methyl-6-methoxy-1,4-benzoquinol hydroxylase [Hyphomonas sp.]|uniref:FAD-dependent monooxygenase n=1 Tax=Hyphomonas sp. TaxID=87 RepID=UPI0017C21708|nr:FAD-dependent monooxygenase [Hyphomonas sp.]MBU3919933.1 FAD-dependent monooxygenase [Alphaproteobacteria bacterium]MBA3068652.1 2-octaprenyl-3-methyl-6-methoxy-1,4-benzoquinol hydroxylase [Hyphomonas sp.]MBU4061971.1 FAD-dependent monooxygenase [Alphaproteobacteria bacterium]MBU4166126.1 FAD-dependent monooxygenase [Alphaproteobacteria bacterium]MBU4568525.1 FAD-dependent monooxygenase [Alphaproteobacteria bacterium]
MTETGSARLPDCDLAVIGAGSVGTSLAILAAQAGFTVTLIDTRPADAPTSMDTRTFAIVRGSWRLLDATGVTADLADVITPLNGLEAEDGGRHWFGAPHAAFNTRDLPPGAEGEPLGQMVPAGALQAALDRKTAATPGINWRRGARFSGMKTGPAGADIQLEDGSTFRAGLVAACDGIHSSVRNFLGIRTEGRSYGKSVFAADIALDRPHHGIARQLFTPEGPFATLPLPGNRANLAWYMKTGAAETLAKLPKEDIEAELNARFSGFAGQMRLDGPPLSYPLVMQIAVEMAGPRTALLGDAARRLNPLAGQGLNLGFKDVAALVDVMTEARDAGLDPGSDTVLAQYQNWRRFDSAATALTMDLIDRTFSNDNPLLKPLRGLALAAVDRLAPLRRALARQASADQDHLPSLMR